MEEIVHLRNELAVGILFFVGLAVLGYFTIIMKNEILDTRDTYNIVVDFPGVNGLKKSERVKMFGVDVGTISDIRIQGRMVRVTIRIYENITFYENYQISISSESIMMGKYLSIDPGTPFTDNNPNAEIDRAKPLVGAPPSDVIALVESIMKENRDDLRESIKNARRISSNLGDITDKIKKGEGTIGKLVTEDQTQEVKELVKEVRDTVEDAREQAPITSFIRSILTIL